MADEKELVNVEEQEATDSNESSTANSEEEASDSTADSGGNPIGGGAGTGG